MEMDLLADIRAEIDKAIAEGRTLRQFRKDLMPILQRRGWWGKKKMKDPLTGKVVSAQLGSPRRLRTIHDLPELISDNDAYKGRDENHLELFGQIEERWYQVVVKQTSNNELFPKTFHEVRARELPAALKTPKEGGARWGPQKNPT